MRYAAQIRAAAPPPVRRAPPPTTTTTAAVVPTPPPEPTQQERAARAAERRAAGEGEREEEEEEETEPLVQPTAPVVVAPVVEQEKDWPYSELSSSSVPEFESQVDPPPSLAFAVVGGLVIALLAGLTILTWGWMSVVLILIYSYWSGCPLLPSDLERRADPHLGAEQSLKSFSTSNEARQDRR